jgi:hypothetical protein
LLAGPNAALTNLSLWHPSWVGTLRCATSLDSPESGLRKPGIAGPGLSGLTFVATAGERLTGGARGLGCARSTGSHSRIRLSTRLRGNQRVVLPDHLLKLRLALVERHGPGGN